MVDGFPPTARHVDVMKLCNPSLQTFTTILNTHDRYVVDGFPRTACQVDFVKLFYDKLQELHVAHDHGPLAINFPRPSFKVSSCGMHTQVIEQSLTHCLLALISIVTCTTSKAARRYMHGAHTTHHTQHTQHN